MAKYAVNSESLTAVADAIRYRDGHSNKLLFPDDYISAVRKGNVPDEYKSYIEQAESMYTGDYANLAVLEWEDYLAIVFMMSDFAVTEYNETTTEFKAQGWVSCSFNKLNDNWNFTDWRDQPSTGGNYVMNIRYSSTPWMFNGAVIWPFGGGESGGGGFKQSEIYDLVIPPKGGLDYTVPRDGALFIVSKFAPNNFSGFETQITKRHRVLRASSYMDSVSATYVIKKNVVSGENIAIPSSDSYSCLILAEPGSNVADCFRTVKRFSAAESTNGKVQGGTIEMVDTERHSGFCYLSTILSAASYELRFEDDLSKAEFSPYETTNIGWAVPGYLTGICDRFSFKTAYNQTGFVGYNAPNSYQFVSFNLSTSGEPVYDIDPAVVTVKSTSTKNFETGKEWSSISDNNGYVVFVGAYRDPDSFPLDGFTIAKEFTTILAGITQNIVVAYKAVTIDELVATPATSGRFGGAFYWTTSNLSKANIVVGNATRESDNIVYPMPGEFDAMFGIAGSIMSTSTVGAANVPDICTWKEEVAGRLTTFYANGFTRVSGASNISFPFTDGDGYEGDVQGIWVKFTFEN